MISWVNNLLLEFVPIFVFSTILLVVAYTLNLSKKHKSIVKKVYGCVLVLGAVVAATGTDTTYKHTTSYDKTSDIKNIQMKEPVVTGIIIEDKSRTMEFSVQEHRKKLDELLDYTSEDKEENPK